MNEDEPLDCGKPVNFTYYDNLVGVQNRHRHPIVPEPHASLIFSNHKRQSAKGLEFNVDALERRLKKAKREVRLEYIKFFKYVNTQRLSIAFQLFNTKL